MEIKCYPGERRARRGISTSWLFAGPASVSATASRRSWGCLVLVCERFKVGSKSAVIRTRVGQLGVRYLDFDKLAGWAEGLSGKIFGTSQVKRLGPEKLFDAIRASGMRIRLEHDPEQTQKMQARIAEHCLPRQANQARPNNRSHMSNKMIGDVLSYLANRKGGLTQLRAAVKEARSNMARHGAKALWEKRRADGPVDFATYLGNSQLRPLALRPPEEPGSSTNPLSILGPDRRREASSVRVITPHIWQAPRL
jgi:hypothetical protein